MKIKVIISDLVIPEAASTRFECRTKKSNGSYTDIVVEKVGVKYYHVSPTGETAEIGDLYAYLRYLRQCNAMWLTRKSKGAKPKTKRILMTREEAQKLLRNGYPMVSLDMNATLTPMVEYTGCICSNGKTIKIEDIPAGDYAVNWTEEPLKETFEEFQARKKEEDRMAAAMKRKREEVAAMREAKAKLAEANATNSVQPEIEQPRVEPTSTEVPRVEPTVEQPKKKGFWSYCKDIALFFGGVAVGVAAYDKLTTKKNY